MWRASKNDWAAMDKPTLVLPPRFSDDSNALWRAAIALGWPIERLQGWTAPEELRGAKVAIYGESLWANHIAEQLDLKLFEPRLDFLARLPPEFVSRTVEFMALGQARQKTYPLFVKPAGDKTFAAQIYDTADELPAPDLWPDDLPVLTSEIVDWEVEYRCFVLDGQVVTASSYWRGEVSTQDESGAYLSPPDELEAALGFAARVLAHERFANGATLDVGIIRGCGWAVIEANPAFGAGIYGCAAERVLETVAACVERN